MVTPAAAANCLIVSANRVVSPYPVYPLGAAYLAGALTSAGHRAEHFDLLADGGIDELAELLGKSKFDLVAVSIRNIDSVDSSAPNSCVHETVETVQCIRQNQDTCIILGGPAFSIMPERFMSLLDADYGVVGEGEELLPWLATRLATDNPPEEKLFRARPGGNIWRPSQLTVSSARYYTERGGMLNVQTKRGCPYGCLYCSYPMIEGTTIRYRDPEEVVDEMERLGKHSGAKYIFFTDSFFNDREGRYLLLAEVLIRRGNTLPWCAFFRPSDVSRKELKLLKRAGLAAMELGTDATTDETLAGLNKNFTFTDVLQCHENILQENIPAAHFVIFGGPNETSLTVQQGLRNLDKLRDCVVFPFIGIRILPGTGIYARALEDGIISGDDQLLEPIFYYSPEVKRQEIEERVLTAFTNRMDRIYPTHEFEQRIAMLHEMGQTGPLWDLLLKNGRRK